MSKNVLVVSPHPAFGELLRLSLEETGAYAVRLVLSGKEALAVTAHSAFDLVLLDGDLQDEPLSTLVRLVQEHLPAIRLIIFPPENDTHHPGLMGLRPDAYLDKPFYLPDLLRAVENLLGAPEPEAPAATLQETPESALAEVQALWQAQGAVIEPDVSIFGQKTRRSILPPPPWLLDDDLAEEQLLRLLPDSGAEAAVIVQNGNACACAGSLTGDEAGDIAALLQKSWDKTSQADLARFFRLEQGECLVYTTLLADAMLLALVFEPSTPLTRIRGRSGRMARALTTPPPPPAPVTSVAEDLDEEDLVGPALTEEERNAILALLADMPPPDPGADGAPELANEWLLEETMPQWMQTAMAAQSAAESDPALEETRPTILPGVISLPQKERAAQHIQHEVTLVCYTGVLIPAVEEHFLTGELAILISHWVPELCASYGWQLDGIAIRPRYLHWTVRVPPSVSPGNIVRSLRQQTSLRIFQLLPILLPQNASGDFWAPGSLILKGAQPPPPELLRDFIDQTRRRQAEARQRK